MSIILTDISFIYNYMPVWVKIWANQLGGRPKSLMVCHNGRLAPMPVADGGH